MLKLKNVSKFYYSNGVITSGFSRVNLELDMGEFVVITGESGSGKSTLLNVLSGLDTYEEGEMYINGQETSHYSEADFEEYRRKYVGNIFQNFNLVNSYTVYQNVELALMLNGEKSSAVKDKVKSIINRVGLAEYMNTKCSKLSGGQKQRVAIARALAKDTPIIVADEPTGNLDSSSAAEVIKLLHEISEEKLVIIVTHNIEQVERYATRLIKMHDGKILEDKKVNLPQTKAGYEAADYKDITAKDRIRLGIRNAFNIPAKFILIFAVFLFVSMAVAGTYSGFQKMEYDDSRYGYNQFFSDTSDKRIVINKEDKTPITDEEFTEIESLENVGKVIRDDTLIDYSMSLSDSEYWYYFYGNFTDIKYFDGELTAGSMPEEPYDIILEGSADDYYLSQDPASVIGTLLYLDEYDENGERKESKPFKVTGVFLNDEMRNGDNNRFYAGEEILEHLRQEAAVSNNNLKFMFEGQYYDVSSGEGGFSIVPDSDVPKGQAYAGGSLGEMSQSGTSKGKEIVINAESIYSEGEMKVTVTAVYNKGNLEELTGVKYTEDKEGAIYVNEEEFNDLVNKGIFQSSVYVSDTEELDNVLESLKEMGFETLAMRDALTSDGQDLIQIIALMKTFMLTVLIVALFFISYFIIKVVLKSRNAYYTTLRTLGASRRVSKQLLDIELFVTATLSFVVFTALIIMINAGILNLSALTEMADYLSAGDYVLIYMIIIAMSYLISHRFARKLFKDSVMNTYREEV